MAETKRIALVTGAGSGIGRVVSIALHAAGFSVVLAGRRREELERTASLAKASAGKMLAVATDVSDAGSVRALFEQIGATYGRLDVLFNNAGTNVAERPIEELTDEQWDGVVSVNMTGAFLCAREAVRMMKAQTPRGGRIINNGSISAHVPRPNSVPYTMTKHAITGLTKCISLDGRQIDIAAVQIDIGNAATEMTAPIAAGAPQADGSVRQEPTFDPQHVADAVAFMAELPLDANVQFLTITATTMPFIGRG